MARVLLCAPNGDVARYSMPRSSMDCRIGMPAGCWGKEEECSVISPTQREDEDGLIPGDHRVGQPVRAIRVNERKLISVISKSGSPPHWDQSSAEVVLPSLFSISIF